MQKASRLEDANSANRTAPARHALKSVRNASTDAGNAARRIETVPPQGAAARAERGPCQPDGMSVRTHGSRRRCVPDPDSRTRKSDGRSCQPIAALPRHAMRVRRKASDAASDHRTSGPVVSDDVRGIRFKPGAGRRALASAVGSQRHPPRRMRPHDRLAAIRTSCRSRQQNRQTLLTLAE
jgi:hypothetical protein